MAAKKRPVLACSFFRTAGGNEPVREWLKSLPPLVRKEIGSDIEQVQWSWPIGKPLVDGLGDGLFEVRTNLAGDIYRVIFCLEGATMVLLHGFQKKTEKTPKGAIDLARRRRREAE